jgi:hypothetical protein
MNKVQNFVKKHEHDIVTVGGFALFTASGALVAYLVGNRNGVIEGVQNAFSGMAVVAESAKDAPIISPSA